MTSDERTFDTGVARSVAHLPDPPAHWSYSGLKEVETCPRRFALERASYPDLWSGLGYPQVPHPAALFGLVVHDSLEQIVKALVKAGCDSAKSPEAVDVLRELGGYSAVAGSALEARLAKLEGNPRVDADRRARLLQLLEDQIPEARTEIQGYLQRMSLVPEQKEASGSASQPASGSSSTPTCRPLGIGSHPEAWLRIDSLRVKGRADLLMVFSDRVEIVDYKTGTHDPSHIDQLRFYAMLWDQDEVANSARTPLGVLTVSYPTSEVTIPAPNKSELLTLVASASARVADADSQVEAEAPVAVTGEHCRHCPVRSICAAYWHEVAPNPIALPVGTWFDYEGIVGQQNGIKSWWMLDHDSRKVELLLRATSVGRPLEPGQRLRILGLRRDSDPEVDGTVATLTVNSEVFLVMGEATRDREQRAIRDSSISCCSPYESPSIGSV
jgi:hypothetical protein